MVGDSEIDRLMVIQDNSTWWNSTYYSLHRGLKLKRRLRIYIDDNRADFKDDCIDSEDWDPLQEISDAQQPFHEAAMRTQGNAGNGHYGAVWEVLPIIETLLDVMEQGRLRYKSTDRKASTMEVAY